MESLASHFKIPIKNLYLQAIGIEIFCITFAEIGQNSSFLVFKYTHIGILIGYILGYSMAGFATFITILGKYDREAKDISCCELQHDKSFGFIQAVRQTSKNFINGIKKLSNLGKQPHWKNIVKSSLFILFTAESSCILTALTVDLIFYRASLFLSIPLSLFIGSFVIIIPQLWLRLQQTAKRKLTNQQVGLIVNSSLIMSGIIIGMIIFSIPQTQAFEVNDNTIHNIKIRNSNLSLNYSIHGGIVVDAIGDVSNNRYTISLIIFPTRDGSIYLELPIPKSLTNCESNFDVEEDGHELNNYGFGEVTDINAKFGVNFTSVLQIWAKTIFIKDNCILFDKNA